MNEFMAGAALALLSAFLGYWAGNLQKRRDDKAKRSSVATALLVELRWLERSLRLVYEHEQAAVSTRRLETPVYDAFTTDLVLFKPDLVQNLLNFRGLLNDLELSYATIEKGNVPVTEHTHYFFRSKAGFAAALVPKLKLQLENAGGNLPHDQYQEIKFPKLPTLPPPSFPISASTRPPAV